MESQSIQTSKTRKFAFLFVLVCHSSILAQSKPSQVAPQVFLGPQPARQTQFGAVKCERTLFRGHEAWRLEDGHTRAVIVPVLARVMEYGFVGEKNILWTNPKDLSQDEIKSYGGDMTWLAPQSQWPLLGGSRWSGWPPDLAWEQKPQTATLLPGPVLRVEGPSSSVTGIAISREYSFAPNGDFTVSQIADKKSGAPLYVSLWNITRVPEPDAVFMPLNPTSPYKQGFYWQSAPRPESVTHLTPTQLQLHPVAGESYKVGADSPVATVVSIREGIAFRLRARKSTHQYPDGADKAGFPVEIYSDGLKAGTQQFTELELLGPLNLTKTGQRWRHTVRWDLKRLTNRDPHSDALRAEIELLLTGS